MRIWPLLDAEGMRALDRHTIEDLGVPGEVLMESAGRAVVDAVLDLQPRRVHLVCGPGNNGGDGWVAARHLKALGVDVRVEQVGEPRGDCAAQRARALAFGVVEGDAEGADVVVDAIFGTGLDRAVEGPPARAIERINARRLPVVAVDLPSGLDTDTGAVHGVAVLASCTVTFGLPKLGLALEPGRSRAGEIRVARIGIADEAAGVAPAAELWSRAEAGRRLPSRPAAGHKGSFGHVLVVAGSEGKTGAAALAGRAAARAGAGLVTIACPAGINDILEEKCTEAMTAPVADTGARGLAAEAEDALLALAATRDVVALGPGIGREPETEALVRALCKRLDKPLVLDADGLNAFEGRVEELRATVITPHPGEAARLLGEDAAAIQRDRVGAARRLADACGAVVLLKGAATVVVAPGARPLVNPSGGPALASGGTGDVLTGVVAALLAQGVGARDAAAGAAFLHGFAADRIAPHGVGLLAGDLADALPEALGVLRGAEEQASGLALRFPEP